MHTLVDYSLKSQLFLVGYIVIVFLYCNAEIFICICQIQLIIIDMIIKDSSERQQKVIRMQNSCIHTGVQNLRVLLL